MKLNVHEVGVFDIVSVVVSGAALFYGYFMRRKAAKAEEALKSKLEETQKAYEEKTDGRIDNVLKRFNRTIADLQQDGYEVDLSQDVLTTIAKEEARSETNKMIKPIIYSTQADAQKTISKEVKATVSDIRDAMKTKVESKIDDEISEIDIRPELRNVLSDLERRLQKKLENDMDDFEKRANDDYKKFVDAKKKLLDIYSDNASEGYALYKNINEKISSK